MTSIGCQAKDLDWTAVVKKEIRKKAERIMSRKKQRKRILELGRDLLDLGGYSVTFNARCIRFNAQFYMVLYIYI